MIHPVGPGLTLLIPTCHWTFDTVDSVIISGQRSSEHVSLAHQDLSFSLRVFCWVVKQNIPEGRSTERLCYRNSGIERKSRGREAHPISTPFQESCPHPLCLTLFLSSEHFLLSLDLGWIFGCSAGVRFLDFLSIIVSLGSSSPPLTLNCVSVHTT